MNLEYQGTAKIVVHLLPLSVIQIINFFHSFFFSLDFEAHFPLLSCSLNIFHRFLLAN